MQDGDAHRLAIEDILAINARGGSYSEALGALIRKRHDTLGSASLDGAFERHDRAAGLPFHSVSHCAGWVGITAVFVVEDERLKLLSVVAFDDFIAEAMSARALSEALHLAEERFAGSKS